MSFFDIYPAIDIRHGQVVRLEEGDPNRQTVFGNDPVLVAQRWASYQPQWLHVVNLDGAFGENSSTTDWKTVLPQLCQLVPRVQLGGGIRSLEAIEAALSYGVTRVVLGTVVVENPSLAEKAILRFGTSAIAIGLDTREGKVQVHGWKSDGGISAIELARKVKDYGAQVVVHTDISRDGLLTGVNEQASAELAQASGMQVIVSGGVAGLEDIRRSCQVAERGVIGVIAGRALYQNKLDLSEALQLATPS